MHRTVTLAYAPRPKPRLRRSIAKIAAASMVAVVLSGARWEVRRRAIVLSSNPSIGPVDWSKMLTSRTLLSAAWQFSSHPAKASNLEAYDVLQAYSASIDLALPIRYADGTARFEFVVTNTGIRPMVVPPFVCVGTIPRDVGCVPASVCVVPNPCLGREVQVVQPGESIRVTVPVRASPRPADTCVTVIYGAVHIFDIRLGGRRGSSHPYLSWRDIQESSVARTVQPRSSSRSRDTGSH